MKRGRQGPLEFVIYNIAQIFKLQKEIGIFIKLCKGGGRVYTALSNSVLAHRFPVNKDFRYLYQYL